MHVVNFVFFFLLWIETIFQFSTRFCELRTNQLNTGILYKKINHWIIKQCIIVGVLHVYEFTLLKSILY